MIAMHLMVTLVTVLAVHDVRFTFGISQCTKEIFDYKECVMSNYSASITLNRSGTLSKLVQCTTKFGCDLNSHNSGPIGIQFWPRRTGLRLVQKCTQLSFTPDVSRLAACFTKKMPNVAKSTWRIAHIFSVRLSKAVELDRDIATYLQLLEKDDLCLPQMRHSTRLCLNVLREELWQNMQRANLCAIKRSCRSRMSLECRQYWLKVRTAVVDCYCDESYVDAESGISAFLDCVGSVFANRSKVKAALLKRYNDHCNNVKNSTEWRCSVGDIYG